MIELQVPDRRGSGAFKWDFAREGEIPMWVADMDFAVAPAVTEALAQRIAHPVFGYAGVPDSYFQALAQWQEHRNRWSIPVEAMVAVPSVMPAIALAVESITRPGDTVATFSPVYFPFFDVIAEAGREVRRIPLRIEPVTGGTPVTGDAQATGETPVTGDAQATGGTPAFRYALDREAIVAGLEGAALLLLCSPHNPGGRVWTPEELAMVREIAAAAQVPVVADEIHADLVFPGVAFVPWLRDGGATDRDIALVAPSKTFNIPGLPSAMAVIPGEAARERYAASLHRHMLRLPNILAMTAAEAAYRGAGEWLDAVRAQIFANYTMLREALAAESGVSVFEMEGTFIAWIDLRERWSSATGSVPEGASERFRKHARERGVWLSSGRQFGPEGEGFMRINVASSPDTVGEGIRRFREALGSFDPGAQ